VRVLDATHVRLNLQARPYVAPSKKARPAPTTAAVGEIKEDTLLLGRSCAQPV